MVCNQLNMFLYFEYSHSFLFNIVSFLLSIILDMTITFQKLLNLMKSVNQDKHGVKMNKMVLMNFLRQVIFLLFILKTVNGIIMIFSAENCSSLFRNNEILPLDNRKPHHALFITIDLVTVIFNGFGILNVIAGLTGFVGAIYLHKFPMINYCAGMWFILLAAADFGSVAASQVLINSLNGIVIREIVELFESSREVVLETYTSISKNQEMYKASMKDGWGKNAVGGPLNHSLIDYIQMNQNCCGVWGRQSWLIMVPTSCCSDRYDDITCNFATAHSMNCMQPYNNFITSLFTIEIQFFFFGVFSVVTVFCSLYLSRLKIRYPDEKYDSDDSLSSDSDDLF